MKTININGYGIIEVENQEVLDALNNLSQEDLVIFGELGYKYIDSDDITRLSSIIHRYYTNQEITKNNIEKVLPGRKFSKKDDIWYSTGDINLKLILSNDTLTAIAEDCDYNKTYNFTDYNSITEILQESEMFNIHHSSYN
jgi:hypothetical protein